MARFTNAQRRPLRTVSRASIASFCRRRLTLQFFRYGQEVKTATNYATRVRYLDGEIPLAIFTFKYRDFGLYIYSLHAKASSTLLTGLLQANGIIPKPPPAKKEATVFEVIDLTTSDGVKREPIGNEIEIVDDAAQKRTTLILSKRPNLSRENEARPAKKIKREKKPVHTGEVIDLT